MSQVQIDGLLALAELRNRAARRAMLEFSPYPAQLQAVMCAARLIVLFGGNQCLGGEQHIFDPVANEYRRVDEITEDFHVEAWDGQKVVIAKAKRPYQKKVESIYEIEFQDGTTVACSPGHLFFGPCGWSHAKTLIQHPESVVCLPRSSSGNVPTIHPEDVERWLNTVLDSLSCYPSYSHLGDGRLHEDLVFVQGVLPSQGGALGRKLVASFPASSPSDDSTDTQDGSHVCHTPRLQASRDGLFLIAAPFFDSESRVWRTVSLPFDSLTQAFPQLLSGSFPDSQSIHEFALSANLYQGDLISCLSSDLFSNQSVSRIDYLRNDVVWDFEVEEWANYFIGSVLNHNSGKSHTAAHKVAYDSLGIYPDWWTGERTRKGIDVWVVGEKFTTTRDSCQKKLFGPNIDRPGEGGLIAPDYVMGKPSRMSGVTGMIDTIKVKHISGQTSTITFKSYEQGREALASWTGDLIWIDEEPPMDCFQELQMRVIARKGQIIVTFTPLKGFTKLYKIFTDPNSEIPCFWLDWDQAKHLDEDTKASIAKMYSSNPAQLKARMTGRAAIATGLVYPLGLDDISCPDFKLDGHFRHLGGLDVGWKHPTAMVAIAYDPDADTYYLYKNHRKAEWTVDKHVDVIRPWGDLDYACDTATLQGDKDSGEKIMHKYLDLLDPGWKQRSETERRCFHASKGVAAGIEIVYKLFQEQKLFVFKSCREVLEEISAYHYDENGKIYKVEEDCMDAMRYALTHPHRFRIPGRCRPSERTVEIKQWKKRNPTRSF